MTAGQPPHRSLQVASHQSDGVLPSLDDVGVGRPVVAGKFLSVGGRKLYVKGATYGAFRPDDDGREYQDLDVVRRDFHSMAASGLNSVRIPHTVPPVGLLDIAQEAGLWVMVGLSAEQYIGYLIDTDKAPDIDTLIASRMKPCVGHPALLCYALGNEIPASVARWLGRRKIERYLHRLYDVAKTVDPDGLVTYVNYPTTEYLRLPFLDFESFNVYLEEQDRFEAYLLRLQNLVGDRPLLMSELGLDSMRNGLERQAEIVEWQIQSTFAAGCAGAFVFSWTDEWYRGGAEVDDWAFGLTTREREPKLSLMAAQEAFSQAPFGPFEEWPKVSVVVCAYNAESTIRDCCQGLAALEYPDLEVIVVDDGSTDRTGAIAGEHDVRVIRTENQGLSHARNVGLDASAGEIVAYIDADAWPDPHWLRYLVAGFSHSDHAAIGGWNIAPAGDGTIADGVANAPGRPLHVLTSDEEAEHIPGVCMAFRRDVLHDIGGFDVQFKAAGDDVDICWRLIDAGQTIGFAHGAFVWHHHRDSLRAYWNQQKGYGRAEALLERKWPQKYNGPGHLTWAGRLYGHGLTRVVARPSRVYHGVWGLAPFQSLETSSPAVLYDVLQMPEWLLVVFCFACLALLGLFWEPFLLALVPLTAAAAVAVVQALVSARAGRFQTEPLRQWPRPALILLTSFLHLLQPVARLWGRLSHGLTPWRSRSSGWMVPWPRRSSRWTRRWRAMEERLQALDHHIQEAGAVVRRGGSHDRWDLEARTGLLGRARVLMAVEDTGSGTQLIRTRTWPCVRRGVLQWCGVGTGLSIFPALSGYVDVAVVLGLITLLPLVYAVSECGRATSVVTRALKRHEADRAFYADSGSE